MSVIVLSNTNTPDMQRSVRTYREIKTLTTVIVHTNLAIAYPITHTCVREGRIYLFKVG